MRKKQGDLARRLITMLRWAALALLIVGPVACRPTQPCLSPPAKPLTVATPQPEENSAPPAATQRDAAASTPKRGTKLLVAGPTGIRVLSLDGTLVDLRSTTPAVAARRITGTDRVVALGADGVLRTLGPSGDETRLASLPLELPCSPRTSGITDAADTRLGLRSDEEMWISEDATSVCVWVSDHAHDLRSNLREVAVRFADGALTQQLTLGGAECGVPEDAGRMAPCGSPPIANTQEGVPSPVGGVAVSESPDGTWSQVLVGSMLGDLLHLQYVLVRNADLAIFPLRHGSGPWPKAVTLTRRPDLEALFPDLPDVIAGETEAWVGPHHLVLDQTLHIAGERSVDLGGDLAPP